MSKILIMGVEVGVADKYEYFDDAAIQYTNFKPNKEVCKIPEGTYISVDLEAGTWIKWGSDGEAESNGLVFEQLA